MEGREKKTIFIEARGRLGRVTYKVKGQVPEARESGPGTSFTDSRSKYD